MVILVDNLILLTWVTLAIICTFTSLISTHLIIFFFEAFFVWTFWLLLILSKLWLLTNIFLLLLSKEAKTSFAWLLTTSNRSKTFVSSTISSNTTIFVSYLKILSIVSRPNLPSIILIDISFWVQAYTLGELLFFNPLWIRTHTHIIGTTVLIFINVIPYSQTTSSNTLLIFRATNEFRLDFHLHFLRQAG